MKIFCTEEIYSNKQIAPNIFDMSISASEIVKYAKAGQFVNLYPKDSQTLLPRPISIAEINLEANSLRLIYAVVGKGTDEFSKLKVGDKLKITGPLGTGFDINIDLTEHVIIAGGIGTPPMLELAKNLKGNIKAYLGFRTNPILVDDFKNLGVEVHIATDDGSVGFKGNNIDLLKQENPKAQMYYACGPKVMLKAAAKWAEENNLLLQVSMEERMACGIGACVGCVCKTKVKGSDEWQHTKVCTNGPVFWSNEVIWND